MCLGGGWLNPTAKLFGDKVGKAVDPTGAFADRTLNDKRSSNSANAQPSLLTATPPARQPTTAPANGLSLLDQGR